MTIDRRRRLRFGYGFYGTGRASLVESVLSAERFGYDTFLMPDHLSEQLSPIPTLAVVAELSETLRVAPWVLCNDFHKPEVVARELATIEALSGGRLDVGMGAGWASTEYARAGIDFESGPDRLRHLKDSVAVIKALLAGGPVSIANDHHHLDGHIGYPPPVQRPHPPLMLGGGGRRMLEWAAKEGDIVSIIPRAAPNGGLYASDLTIEALEEKISWVKDAAGARFDQITLNLVLVDMTITTERRSAARSVSDSLRSGKVPIFVVDADLSEDDLLDSPYFAFGTVPEIAERIAEVCERTGVTYYGVFPHLAEAFGPVVQQLQV